MDTNTIGSGEAPDNNNNESVDKHVESAFQSLRRDYSLVGKRHIRAWKAWLAIGLATGIAAGVILVANRSGEVEPSKATTAPFVSCATPGCPKYFGYYKPDYPINQIDQLPFNNSLKKSSPELWNDQLIAR